MAWRALLLVLAGAVGVGVVTWGHGRAGAEPKAAAETPVGHDPAAKRAAMLEAARKTYQLLQPTRGVEWEGSDSVYPAAEHMYIWSRRWMEAERDAADDPEGRAAAVAAHLDRMRQWDRRVQRRAGVGLLPESQAKAAEYFVAEAELWAAEAGQ